MGLREGREWVRAADKFSQRLLIHLNGTLIWSFARFVMLTTGVTRKYAMTSHIFHLIAFSYSPHSACQAAGSSSSRKSRRVILGVGGRPTHTHTHRERERESLEREDSHLGGLLIPGPGWSATCGVAEIQT